MTKKETKRPPDAKKPEEADNNGQRQSRKEILIARKHERQMRNIWIAVAVIVGLIAVVAAVALVNELVITPRRAVVTVGEDQVTLRDWQERVRYERAQRIIFLENQLESFGGDVGIVQQFGGQVITELLDPESMGQNTLNVMADELVLCRALEERGVTITDADVDAQIGRYYNYFGGESPTPEPTAPPTVVPTPSLTPIPTAVITEVVPTATPFPTPLPEPTQPPPPTPTPVSQAAFEEQFGELRSSLASLGVDESVYRSVVRAQICRERLADILAEEQELSTIAPHASLFLISFETEEEANAALEEIQNSDYLTVWNTVQSRSQPVSEADTEFPSAFAFELLWRTQDNLESSIGPEIAGPAFELPINEPTEVISVANTDGSTTYYIVMVSGREERELSDAELQTRKQELLQTYLDEQLTEQLTITDAWRGRVPILPVLDTKFLAQPTPAPTQPPLPTSEAPADEATPEAEP